MQGNITLVLEKGQGVLIRAGAVTRINTVVFFSGMEGIWNRATEASNSRFYWYPYPD